MLLTLKQLAEDAAELINASVAATMRHSVQSDRVDLAIAAILTFTGSFFIIILACAYG